MSLDKNTLTITETMQSMSTFVLLASDQQHKHHTSNPTLTVRTNVSPGYKWRHGSSLYNSSLNKHKLTTILSCSMNETASADAEGGKYVRGLSAQKSPHPGY